MSEDKNAEGTLSPKGSRMNLLIVVLAAFIAFSFAGFGTARLLLARLPVREAGQVAEKAGPLYDAGEFTVNIAGSNASRFLRTKITFELNDKELETELEEQKAIWQDEIVTVLSGKDLTALDVQNRDALKKELLGRLAALLGPGKIKNLYFTSFLIQ